VAAARPRYLAAANDTGATEWARCLALTLDEVGYGMLLVDAYGALRHMNHAARDQLDTEHPLQVSEGRLLARDRAEAVLLKEALAAAAARGTRDMLLLGEGAARISMTVLPLGAEALEGAPATLLLLGRRHVSDNLSVQFFARCRGLTPTETRVLELLCGGMQPVQIALLQGVRISTIRTQIGGIREKTGARSIRDVINMVSLLPPMVPSLRPGFAGAQPGRVASR
jgi:DNA-binding CsgD family transcriptional regulator